MMYHGPKLSHKLFLSINHQTEVLFHGLQSKSKVICGMLGLKIEHVCLIHTLQLYEILISSEIVHGRPLKELRLQKSEGIRLFLCQFTNQLHLAFVVIKL
jgi:putative lipase involved disintegration of autophagic bodies